MMADKRQRMYRLATSMKWLAVLILTVTLVDVWTQAVGFVIRVERILAALGVAQMLIGLHATLMIRQGHIFPIRLRPKGWVVLVLLIGAILPHVLLFWGVDDASLEASKIQILIAVLMINGAVAMHYYEVIGYRWYATRQLMNQIPKHTDQEEF